MAFSSSIVLPISRFAVSLFFVMRYLLLAVMVPAFAMAVLKIAGRPDPSLFQPTVIEAANGSHPNFFSGFASTGKTRLVHAPSMVEMGDGRIIAFWFAGSREGAADVVIHSSVYNPRRMSWSGEKTVTSRLRTQKDVNRYIRKLGNPVPARDASGTLWLFFVSAVGGWSTSAVNAMSSVDDGEHWSPARRLVTSPFLNLSTLVKTAPFFYRDGTLGLPIYHEMLGKFGELLRLDETGEIVSKQRLSYGRQTLQPLVLIEHERNALALMRYSGPPPRRARRVISRDGGKHWSAPEPSHLPNPDSAMTGVALHDGSQLLVLNHDEVMRDELSLVWSNDQGRHWTVLHRFENERRFRGFSFSREAFAENTIRLVEKTDAAIANSRDYVSAVRDTMCHGHPCRFQFDYPYLIQAGDGTFHLLYTWNRSYIKHVQFNQAWLDAERVDPRMMRFTDATGMLSGALAVIMAGLLAGNVGAWKTKTSRIGGLCALTLAALLPIEGLPVAGYMRGIVGDLSITTTVMMLLGIGSRAFHRRLVPEKQVIALCAAAVLCGLIFYPMALGATPYDPYQLGYDSYYFLCGLLLLGVAAWLQNQFLITSCITLAVLAYSMSWYASTNLWDYLLDPLLVVYSLLYLLLHAARWARRKQRRTSGLG